MKVMCFLCASPGAGGQGGWARAASAGLLWMAPEPQDWWGQRRPFVLLLTDIVFPEVPLG